MVSHKIYCSDFDGRGKNNTDKDRPTKNDLKCPWLRVELDTAAGYVVPLVFADEAEFTFTLAWILLSFYHHVHC